MKKKWILVGLIICTIGLTGCASRVPLSDDEEGMVAEYMAKGVLESQKGYTQALLEPTAVPEPTKEPSNEATVTIAPTQATTKTEESSANTSGDDSLNQQANADFAQVMGMSDVDVEYIGYERMKSLTDTSFNFEASSGKELLIAKFQVKNLSKKELQFNLAKVDILYQLDINLKDKFQPLVTLKENDLRFIDVKIEPDGTKETVIMFEISKELKIEQANLIISKEDKTAIIKLK